MHPHRQVDRHAEVARPIRWLYAAAGVTCVGLGYVGIFVPGLPTTIFLLIATWLFTRSCPVLEDWLLAHPILGPYVRPILVDRAMPARAKFLAIAAMWVMTSISMWLIGFDDAARSATAMGVALLSAIGTAFIIWGVRTGTPGDGRA